jgi:hypothetical protein
LGFSSVPTTSNAAASFVIGQSDFVSGGNGSAANQLYQPETIAVNDGKFYVADYGNNRIKVWNSIPTGNTSADYVIGQSGFGATASTCDNTTLFGPEQVFIVGSKLIVADAGHNRVLIWNSIPTSAGTAASVVLGQPDFVTCSSGVAANKMNYPTGIWSDGTKLFVTDGLNKRVLVWNTFPTSSATAPDFVMGQSDFTSNTGGVSSTKFGQTGGITSNGTQLYLADVGNHRVLIWNSLPTSSSSQADIVLGQSSFTRSAANDDNQDGVADASPTARTFSGVYSLSVTSTQLIVSDSENYRVLIFDGI